MKTIKEEFDEIVQECWGIEAIENKYFFSYTEEGNYESIGLKVIGDNYNFEVNLWHSELDDRRFDESKNEYEPLKKYIKRQLKKVMDDFSTFNKLWK